MAGYDESIYRMYLAEVPMFAHCTTAQLDLVARLGEADTYPAGQAIVREGDAGDGFFVMTGGRAQVHRADHEVAELGTGDYFGELALFDPAPRDATVTAIDTVNCVVLSADAFRRALDEVPSVRDALLHGMARRIHELDRALLITCMSARGSVAPAGGHRRGRKFALAADPEFWWSRERDSNP